MRRSLILRPTAILLLICMFLEILYPSRALAITGGPSQPETQAFTPAGVDNLVNPFTGDFNYQIPLMTVGDYPLTLSYSSGASMEQEAAWVGLGWDLNIGEVKRSLRGLPDDFKGDTIFTENKIKPSQTYGAGVNVNFELFGIGDIGIPLSVGLSGKYNNYNGFDVDAGIGTTLSAGTPSKGGLTGNLGIGVGLSTDDGFSVSTNASLSAGYSHRQNNISSVAGLNLSTGYSSKEGIKSLDVGHEFSPVEFAQAEKKVGFQTNASAYRQFAKSKIKSIVGFAGPTSIPKINTDMESLGLSFSFGVGPEVIGFGVFGGLNAYYSSVGPRRDSEKIPSFGYLYSEKANSSTRFLHDFNREKDGGFSRNLTDLPVTNYTYDIFSVSAQGCGGSFRPFRGDLGSVHDPKLSSDGSNINLPSVELGTGSIVHLGSDFSVIISNTKTGKWESDNRLKDRFRFSNSSNNTPKFEPKYFRELGEQNIDYDDTLFSALGGYDAVAPQIDGKTLHLKDTWTNGKTIPSNVNRTVRRPRGTVFSYLTAEEAGVVGLQKRIPNHGLNNFRYSTDINSYTYNSRIVPEIAYPKHHISEITVLKESGTRYIFGIPVYNKEQIESTFSIKETISANESGSIVKYTSEDDSPNNSSGNDNYFQRETTPEYSTAYLLTAIISPDYVDVTGDGPTDDDLGSYTRFNYTRYDDDYQWRSPYEENTASFNEGLKGKQAEDDKASYLYGKKELWYLHSIVTKTHIAEFDLRSRNDGRGVKGQTGGRELAYGSGQMLRLNEIRLYAKPEKIKEANNLIDKALPLKTVHFEYDYSLCDGVPNNVTNNGKLTLKSVFFTYQNANKGRFNSYQFSYGELYEEQDGRLVAQVPANQEIDFGNPNFNLDAKDRWGCFKPNNSILSNVDFPYTEQDKTLADKQATAWNLTGIELPTGGKIKVMYESDDYAYVQDRNAMNMVKLTGVSTDSSSFVSNSGTTDLKDFLQFELETPLSGTLSEVRQEIGERYLKDIISGANPQKIYFKILTDVLKKDPTFEYVTGYADIEEYGPVEDATNNQGAYTHGYIKLKEVAKGKNPDDTPKINPITRAAINFARLYYPKEASGGNLPKDNTPAKDIFQHIVELLATINESTNSLSSTRTPDIQPEKSWIRLFDPNGFKQGGGCRVKQIRISDEWNELLTKAGAGDQFSTTEYGKIYDYTTTNDDGTIISSGVASYEPLIGGDENPFRQPVAQANRPDFLLVPSPEYFLQEPFGESFFPSPSVGYSKCTITDVGDSEVKKNSTGFIVNEYYTAKDFPTRTDRTGLRPEESRSDPLLQLLSQYVRDKVVASEGYAIELNNMHGQVKCVTTFAEPKDANSEATEISKEEYIYKTSAGRLSNTVNVIHKNIVPGRNTSLIETKQIGVDYDVITDMREQESTTFNTTVQGNVSVFLVGIIPGVSVTVIPQFGLEETSFRSIVVTKVINRSGILDRIVSTQYGSQVVTRNLLFDAETGDVLLTETNNRFDEPVYIFNYPAHFSYEGMSCAFENIDAAITNTTLTLTEPGQNVEDFFYEGDEIIYEILDLEDDEEEKGRAWVIEVNQETNSIVLLDREGKKIGIDQDVSQSMNLRVIRSGRRNMAGMPTGTIVTKANPINGASLVFDPNQILDAEAMEYTDEWPTFCECEQLQPVKLPIPPPSTPPGQVIVK